MRSFEYVTIEGQVTRVPVVMCAGGALVVREAAIVRKTLESDCAVEYDAPLLARARDVALRENHASSSTKFIDLVTRLSSRLLNAAFRSRDRNVALRENHATTDAELRSHSRSLALNDTQTNAELRHHSRSFAPSEQHAATDINTSADLAHSQRIYANGS